MSEAEHWQEVYARRQHDQVSWFEDLPRVSLAMIAACGLPSDAAIIDVGGGASRLAGALLDSGFSNITVADLSAAALAQARDALGARAEQIAWVECDIRLHRFRRSFDLWHDRAVFHFMVQEADRERYLSRLREALRPGGHLLLATFGPEGPERCSDLPVRRYGAEELAETLGEQFELLSAELRIHNTPGGATQQFLHLHARRRGDA